METHSNRIGCCIQGCMISRRRFNHTAVLAAAAAGMGEAYSMAAPNRPEVVPLHENGWMPNNPRLPVLLYRGVLEVGEDAARKCEQRFEKNGWPPQWRNGVYTFHHYHATAQEILGFTAGHGRLVLGGEGGPEYDLRAGDVLALPTGTGHCELSCSADFQVIGAYPPGQHWDICRSAPDAATRERMLRVPFPATDPVFGMGGPLAALWRKA